MSKKNEDFSEKAVDVVGGGLNNISDFFNRHQKLITYFAIFVLVVVGGYFGYKYLYSAPRAKQAAEEMFFAEQYFAMDSINLALNGDGQHYGFIDIVANYGNTPSGNIARYAAGMCYMKKGEFLDAIAYLSKFKSDDLNLRPLAKSAIGDAYWELGELKKAAESYEKAVGKDDYITPSILMKKAAVYEALGDYKKALSSYESLQKNHPQSMEARDADKFIAKTKALLNN